MNRALLVGINNYPAPNQLNGCINDVSDMGNFLVANCNFSFDDIRLLTDERATTDAINERLAWLVSGIREGDRILFHYSGHGAQYPVRNPQGQVDTISDCICPVDFDWTDQHVILDADFRKIFLGIPSGVEFIWVSDSCFSGGLVRGMMKPHAKIKTIILPADINWRIQTARSKDIKPLGFKDLAQQLNLVLIAACTSEQEASDAVFNDRNNGALTYYLLQELANVNGLITPLSNIVPIVNSSLHSGGYNQAPVIEGNSAIQSRAFLAV